MAETNPHALSAPSSKTNKLVVSFGLVSIPTRVSNAVADAKTHRSNFTAAGNPVGILKIDKVTGHLAGDLIAKAKATDGEWVELTDEEWAACTSIEGVRKGTAEVQHLIPLDAIGTVYLVEGVSFIRPDEGGEKPLALFFDALGQLGKAALVKHASRGQAKWSAITPDGHILRLRFAEEVRQAPAMPEPSHSDAELNMALALLESLPDEPPVLRDDGRTRTLAFLDAKQAGKTPDLTVPVQDAPVIDLMAALAASVDAANAKPAKVRKAS